MSRKIVNKQIKRKVVWIIGIMILLLVILFYLFIGFFYTSYIRFNNFGMGSYDQFITHSFYLYKNKIYVPVSVNVHGKIELNDIPEYIGVPISSASEIVFAKPFSGYAIKGKMIGQAEGDFLNDTEDHMNQVFFYEILDQERQPISGFLWAEDENGNDSLAVAISEPYSNKMLHLSKWNEYARDVLIMTEAKSGIEWSHQCGFYPGESKYFKDIKENAVYKFRRNWAFFYYDIFHVR